MNGQEIMKKEFVETANVMLGLQEDSEIIFKNVSEETIVGLMLCKRLDRIADALEAIKSSAEIMEQLTGCISSSQRGNQFCITGDVATYEP